MRPEVVREGIKGLFQFILGVGMVLWAWSYYHHQTSTASGTTTETVAGATVPKIEVTGPAAGAVQFSNWTSNGAGLEANMTWIHDIDARWFGTIAYADDDGQGATPRVITYVAYKGNIRLSEGQVLLLASLKLGETGHVSAWMYPTEGIDRVVISVDFMTEQERAKLTANGVKQPQVVVVGSAPPQVVDPAAEPKAAETPATPQGLAAVKEYREAVSNYRAACVAAGLDPVLQWPSIPLRGGSTLGDAKVTIIGLQFDSVLTLGIDLTTGAPYPPPFLAKIRGQWKEYQEAQDNQPGTYDIKHSDFGIELDRVAGYTATLMS